jgi:predicted metal-dependent hydrolase
MRAKRRRRLQTTGELKAAVGDWATKIKARPKQIRIQRMTHKWASCSSSGRITFNSELFGQPYRFQEFVIVHELLHLKIPNHGKLFKSLLKAYLPNLRFSTSPARWRH